MSSATSDGLLPALPGYRVRDQIGRGGFGVVFLGEAEDGQPVAIKVLHRVLDEDARRRFDGEIQIMGTLAWHPNIVRIFDAGTVEGQPYIVMEHLPHGSLGMAVRAEGPLPWGIVLRHAVDAATALQVAHNAGLLHRDVKPDNLLRTEEGQVKLSDFGVTVAASSTDVQRGATGTLAYSAPELLAGASPSPASDIYALGATMFALLRGDPAFHRTTDESAAALILRAYRDPLPDLRPTGAPESLVRVIERAMAKDPADRPGTAADLVKELRGAAAAESFALPASAPTGQPIPAAAPQGAPTALRPPPAARKRAQRLQRLTRGVAAVAAVFIAVSVITVTDFGQPPGEDAAEEPPAATAQDDQDAAAEEPGEGAVEEPGDAAPPPQEVDPEVDAEPLPQPTQTGVPAPPPAPPPPPLPGVGGPTALPPVELDSPAVGGAGDVDRTFVATATTLSVHDADGTQTATAPLEGISHLAVTGDLLGALVDDTLLLLDADTLQVQTTAAVPGAVEVAAGGDKLWAATPEGLVRIGVDGTTTPVRGMAAGTTQVAATEDVVWTAGEDDVVTGMDAQTGRSLAPVQVEGKISELTVLPDGSALAVVDGRLVSVDQSGSVQVLDVAEPVLDVAAADSGVVYLLTGSGLQRIQPGGSAITLQADGVRALWPAGPVVAAAVDGPSSVQRLG